MTNLNLNDLNLILKIAELAGQKILEFYNKENIQSTQKIDKSPLTEADLMSHKFIKNALKKNYNDIPILSEEGDLFNSDEEIFWCIDPLDGTKEFIKKNGEFTVNIALINNKIPILGVIHIPVFNESFSALQDYGAFHIKKGRTEKLVKQKNGKIKTPTFAVSRSHLNVETEGFIKKHKAKIIKAGSSLKLGLLAQGKADAYPRFGPTSLWDIAAGHAILKETGGDIYTKHYKPLLYNSNKIINPEIIAVRNRHLKFK